MPIIRDIFFGAARRGASLKELSRLTGITEEQLRNTEIKVPFEQAQDVWRHAVKLTGDALLGLHIGEDTTTSIVGLTGHLMQTSPDLKSAFENVVMYNELFTNMFQYGMVEKNGMVILDFKPTAQWRKLYPETAAQAVDQALSGTLNAFKLLSGKMIMPVKVDLVLRNKKHRDEYERVMGASLKITSDVTRLHFTTDQLATPVLSYDKTLFELFSRLLTERKLGLKKSKSVRDEIKELLLEVYQFQAPTLEALASQLNLVPRTLQRKLEQEGTSYRALVLEMRQDLSRQLLRVDDSKVKGVAAMLGYSDSSSFRRAFKKWTNKSPTDFKKR